MVGWSLRGALSGVLLLPLLGLTGCGGDSGTAESPAAGGPASAAPAGVSLPRPRTSGAVSVEQAIAGRRSVREFAEAPLSLDEVSQLLWAAQGVTDAATGYRAAPSAGALYPLEVYLVVERVTGLSPGSYRYVPGDHALAPARAAATTSDLAAAALSQTAVSDAPAVLVLAAVYERTTGKYGERGRRYVHMETGHAAENVYLEAEALGLGTVAVGAFDDGAVAHVAGLRPGEEPLYLLPCGMPAGQ